MYVCMCVCMYVCMYVYINSASLSKERLTQQKSIFVSAIWNKQDTNPLIFLNIWHIKLKCLLVTVSVNFTPSQKNSNYIGRVANNVFGNFRLSVYCIHKFLTSDCLALHATPTSQIPLWYFRSPTVSLCRKIQFWPCLHADPHIWGSRQEVYHGELPPGHSATRNA